MENPYFYGLRGCHFAAGFGARPTCVGTLAAVLVLVLLALFGARRASN
jgi:hypothetical protein